MNVGTKAKPKIGKRNGAEGRPRCGLCGKTKKLTKTECCNQWICDDEDKYVLFSYATNSCLRNHRRYTLCGYHHFEELENPPAYLPTKCARCGTVISLGYDGYSTKGDKYWCEECTHKEMESI